jgi:uncharacterized membrane protein
VNGGDRLTRALGWFSVGLGIAELAAPRRLSRVLGVEGNPTLVRSLGAREIASGVGILTSGSRPAGWMWSRVAGDAMDLALLGASLRSERTRPGRVAAAAAAVAGVTALDVMCGARLSKGERGLHLVHAVRIAKSPEELYGFWRSFENLPRFMEHLESVRAEANNSRSHWVARAPMGTTVEWDAEIVEDRPNERIAWRSLEGADVDNAGSVDFIRMGEGGETEVRVEMSYEPPGVALGAAVATLFGEEPVQQIKDDLRRLKRLMETGEIPTTEGQPTGRVRMSAEARATRGEGREA